MTSNKPPSHRAEWFRESNIARTRYSNSVCSSTVMHNIIASASTYIRSLSTAPLWLGSTQASTLTAPCAPTPIMQAASSTYPTIFNSTFRPDTAEAPCTVADNIFSRRSHCAHEAKKSEYARSTELYGRVMDEKAKEATHSNTAKMIARVNYPIIQVCRYYRSFPAGGMRRC